MKLNSTVISLLALVISTLSAMFSYVQYRTATAQLHLNEQQTRPYVKYQPYFTAGNGTLQIDMALENFSPIPKRGGVCNPAANILCEVTASDMAQNISDGLQIPSGFGMAYPKNPSLTLCRRAIGCAEERSASIVNWLIGIGWVAVFFATQSFSHGLV